VPLMHLERVVSNTGGEVSGSVAMEAIAFRQLTEHIKSVWLDKRFYMPHRLVNCLSDPVHEGEVPSRWLYSQHHLDWMQVKWCHAPSLAKLPADPS